MSLVLLSQLSLAQVAPAEGATGGVLGFLPIVLMFVVLYFLMIRPQMKRQKEHKKMVDELKNGDEIITNGGVLGRISKVTETYITVEIANIDSDKAVEVLIQRGAVANVLPKGTLKSL